MNKTFRHYPIQALLTSASTDDKPYSANEQLRNPTTVGEGYARLVPHYKWTSIHKLTLQNSWSSWNKSVNN